MLNYEEHQILFKLGDYSVITSSVEYGGLNPMWASSCQPTPAHSELNTLKPPVKSAKPASTTAVIRPCDLDDEMILDDNKSVALKAKSNGRIKDSKDSQLRKGASATIIEDSEPETNNPQDATPFYNPFDEQENEDVDMEDGVDAEREYALSPVKKEVNDAEVSAYYNVPLASYI